MAICTYVSVREGHSFSTENEIHYYKNEGIEQVIEIQYKLSPNTWKDI